MKKVIALSILITVVHFLFYTAFELAGDVENAPLTSHRFGVHEELKKIGVKETFKEDNIVGWDGQFYYHMANDPFDVHGFSANMDKNAYRMQRVGLSLWSRTFASLVGYEFFPPSIAILSYFLLFALSLYFLAKILLFYNLSPYWMFVWVLAPGTQITLFNYLPDAAADCFLFMAIYFYLKEEKKIGFLALYSISISLAALSREVYILLPFFIFLFEILNDYKLKLWRWKIHLYTALPGLVFLTWQIWLRYKYHASPSSQAAGILDWPLRSWFWGLNRAHTALDAVLLILFFVAIITQCILSIRVLKSNQIGNFGRAIAYFSLAISFIYLCFGVTVMQDWTGYLKPTSLYFILIPMTYSLLNQKVSPWFRRTTIFFVVCSFLVLYFERLLPAIPPMANIYSYRVEEFRSTLSASGECSNFIKGSLDVSLKEPLYKNDFIRKLFFRPYLIEAQVLFDNESEKDILPTKGTGDVQIDYEWKDKNNHLVQVNSIPTKTHKTIPAQSDLQTGIILRYPSTPGEYQLRVFLNQKDCGDLSQYDSRLSWNTQIKID